MTSTPNHQSTPSEAQPVSPEVRALYSVDTINEWRSDEAIRLGWLRGESIESGTLSDEYITTFRDSVDDKIDEFLRAKGVAPDDAEYAAIRQLYRESSIDRVHENVWGNSPASRGVDPNDRQSQQDRVAEAIRQWHHSQHQISLEQPADEERTIDMIQGELDAARDEWAALQAKRQSRLWDRRIHGYNAAKERYETLQRELGSRTLEETVNDPNLSDAEKNTAVIAYIFDEQRALRAQTKEKVSNTSMSRFVEKFGGWLNKGNSWSKIGKGVTVGLGAAVVGAGAGLLFGVAGMGAAVAGVGAVVTGAARFTKAYAKSDEKLGRGMVQIEESDKTVLLDDLNAQGGDNIFHSALSVSRQKFESDTKKEQEKRRKTAGLALGGMALGAGVGTTIAYALEHSDVLQDIFSYKQPASPEIDPDESTSGRIDPRIHDQRDDEIAARNLPDAPVDPLPIDPNDGEMPDPGEAEVPVSEPVSSEIDTLVAGFSLEAQTIECGEGGWRTLGEMGLDTSEYEEAWERVGVHLSENGHDDLVYRMNDGRWGWSRPGLLNKEQLDLIAEIIAKSR